LAGRGASPPRGKDKYMKKYKYFVSYYFTTGTSMGYGNTEVIIDSPITGYQDNLKVQDAIKNSDPEREKVIILYWRRFEDPE
jgi:hypothetical protein